jgi:hypothetical protein
MVAASCHLAGAQNFEVAPIFWDCYEVFCFVSLKYFFHSGTNSNAAWVC